MQSIKGKVILAFLLGAGAIGLALGISYLGLHQMMFVVDDLVEPNYKLNTLNQLYRKVTRLEQEQRLAALEKPFHPDKAFIAGSQSISGTLDTLLAMKWDDPSQLRRLKEMRHILLQRDSLFLLYLKLRSNAIKNRQFAKRFDTLSQLLSANAIQWDTSVRTTQKKKTTITYRKDSTIARTKTEPKRSFFARLFNKKRALAEISSGAENPKQEVKEEIQVTVDTLAMAARNNELKKANQIIQALGENELNRRQRLAGRELALVRTTNILFNQMIQVLNQVEREEISSERHNNELASMVFNRSLIRIVIILLFFSLMAAALIYLILVDIAKSNYFKEQLILAKNKAEELGQVKDRFLTNMSHEIRTPLQSIIGYTEQLPALPEVDRRQALLALQSSSQHLLHIVNDVLDYSRLESGKLELDHSDFYLLETVEDVAEAMRIQADKKRLSFVLDVDEAGNEYVSGDPFRLQQILYNLIGNAIKFTVAGYVKLIVHTQLIHCNVQCRLDIIDTGIGIRPEEITRIFSRFEQANPAISGTYGGAGLGLSIVRQLVDLMNGELDVASTPEEGTRFSVLLSFPLAPPKEDRMSAQRDPMHVLVVDDDPLILKLCGMILQKRNISYSLCDKGEELYSQLPSESITHILLDVRMPHVNGFELCRFLRKKLKASVLIIAMSAQETGDPSEIKENGFNALLVKPFRQDDLYNILSLKNNLSHFLPDQKFTQLRKLTMGDEDLFLSVLSEFIKETTEDISLLRNCIDENLPNEAAMITHKLSGRLAQLGFMREADELRYMEHRLLNDPLPISFQAELTRIIRDISHILSDTNQRMEVS